MHNPFSLEGKTILITGASSGIGRQCAIDCSKMGAKIVLWARNKERLNETLSYLEGKNHVLYSLDLSNLSEIKKSIQDVVSEVGKLNGFIHAAGIEKTKPIKFLNAEDYDELFRINCLSAFEIVKNLDNVYNFHNGGSIVLIASISGIIARNGLSAYAASKGALISSARVMASEMSRKNIRVNTISPGTILTPMMQNVFNEMSEEDRKKRIEDFPLGLGSTTDISNACIYLISDASRWITGQNLIIDGGFTAK